MRIDLITLTTYRLNYTEGYTTYQGIHMRIDLITYHTLRIGLR